MRLFLCLLTLLFLSFPFDKAQAQDIFDSYDLLHQEQNYAADIKYDYMLRRALNKPDDFRFGRFRSYYIRTTQYDPFDEQIGEQLLNHAYTVQTSRDPKAVEGALLSYRELVGKHMANVGVLLRVLALCKQDMRLGNPEFFGWMLEGIMEKVMRSGDGMTLAKAYDIASFAEETLLLARLNLVLIKTESRKSGRISYHMHTVKERSGGEEFTIFVDATYPMLRVRQKERERRPSYTIDIRRQ